VEGGGLFTCRFRTKNLKFLGPSLGPGTPPAVSGSFCCAFWWWYFQPRSSILDPFRDAFSCSDFYVVRNPVSEGVKSPLSPPVPRECAFEVQGFPPLTHILLKYMILHRALIQRLHHLPPTPPHPSRPSPQKGPPTPYHPPPAPAVSPCSRVCCFSLCFGTAPLAILSDIDCVYCCRVRFRLPLGECVAAAVRPDGGQAPTTSLRLAGVEALESMLGIILYSGC
jgi:hypothetical protein